VVRRLAGSGVGRVARQAVPQGLKLIVDGAVNSYILPAMETETTARFENIGMADNFWFARRGTRVLCDRLVRARRFKSEAAALKAGRAASDAEFY
jgi:hypothetical protein